MSLPAALSAQITEAIPDAQFLNDPDKLSDMAGAYCLLIRLDQARTPKLTAFPEAVFPPGWYVYCGSAYGPGGLKSRLSRHLRKDKKPRWHVDTLTCVSSETFAVPVIGGSECALLSRLISQSVFSAPVPGFGSSDCRTCSSHLLIWNGG